MVWIFAHRFHAEFNVARLLAPFLLAAPTYDVQLLLATQVSDEHRHLQAVLRIYEEVFGVQRRHRRRARGRRPEHGPRRRAPVRAARPLRRAPLGELGRGRVPRGRRRLPPAGRGRDRPDGAEPRGQPVREALVPRPRRGPAPRRPRRGTPHRHRRDVRAAAHGAGSRAHARGHHTPARGAADALVGPARARERRDDRARAHAATGSSRSSSTRRRCGWSSCASHPSATT